MGEQGGSCVWGKSGGCEVGKGGAESQGAGAKWLDGRNRKRAGPILDVTPCVQGHCARARVGEARTFRLDLALSLPVDSARM